MVSSVRLRREDRLFFTEQMSLLLAAGVSIVPAIDLLMKTARKRSLSVFLEALKQGVQSGSSISAVLKLFERTFPPLYVALIEVGEVSGKLPAIFDYLGEIERQRLSALKAAQKALIYPIMVLLVAIGVLLFILMAVVPTFEALYQSGGVELPGITQKVLALSDYLLSSSGLWLLAYLLLFLWFVRALFRRQGRFRYWCDQKVLQLPLIGSLCYFSFNAGFSQIVSVMLRAGIPLVKSIELYEEGVQNLFIRQQLISLRQSLVRGDSFYQVAQQSGIFTDVALTLISVGEVSGTLVAVLERSGAYHADSVAQSIDAFIALIDPLSLLLIGGIVGVVLVALYLPMFNMGMTI